MKAKVTKVVKLAFLGLAFICLILPLTKLDMSEKSATENRNLAPWPQMKAKVFGKEFEAWLGDRFRFRTEILALHRHIEREMGVNEVKDAFIGQEGWLFYRGNKSEMLYTRELYFSEQEKKDIMEHLAGRRAALAQQGCSYFVFISPDKSSVYPEYYRTDLVRQEGPDRIEDLVDYLEAHDAPQKLHYFLPDVQEHKGEELLYWKEDTHWNEAGAYWGYLAMMKEIGKSFPDAKPLALEKMKSEFYERGSGDLTKMLQLPPGGACLGEYRRLVPEDGWHFKTIFADKTAREKLYLHTKREGRPYRVLIFMDSFTQNLSPYLAESFGEVMFVWTHKMDSKENKQRIAEFKPDIVIEEVVARLAGDLLPEKGRK